MFEQATIDGILLDFMIYQGNIEPCLVQPPGQHWLQTEQIQLTLMDPYLDRGYTLTSYNWYTTLQLAKYLLHRSTKVIGTVRNNRNNFLKDVPGDKEMQKGSAVFKKHENMLAMKYRGAKDKTAGKPKTVHVILTKHSARMVNTSKADVQGNIFRKSKAIVYYNTNVGDADRTDQQLHGIHVLRKAYKWYQRYFFTS